ncbi:hypothetical protein [Ectobacillus ponti]|uniref:Uncharacterized protein n=1 Tax=Ectobacillus ponti TaxID=2961894 RepID=A0AA41X7I0_9BACI|nr:hypothetical protein [Ectobacillus ponti]MCP8970177.1 hypothetical protein [Ectobacillus ponti]
MIRAILLSICILFGIMSPVSAAGQVEIFDLSKEQVVKRVPMQPEMRREALSYIKEITAVYPNVKPIPRKGYIIRVPLQPPAAVENSWVKTRIDEVFIISSGDAPPVLFFFNEKNQPYFFLFNGDVQKLWQLLQFQPAGE